MTSAATKRSASFEGLVQPAESKAIFQRRMWLEFSGSFEKCNAQLEKCFTFLKECNERLALLSPRDQHADVLLCRAARELYDYQTRLGKMLKAAESPLPGKVTAHIDARAIIRDEIGKLQNEYNSVLDKLRSSLVHSQRLHQRLRAPFCEVLGNLLSHSGLAAERMAVSDLQASIWGCLAACVPIDGEAAEEKRLRRELEDVFFDWLHAAKGLKYTTALPARLADSCIFETEEDPVLSVLDIDPFTQLAHHVPELGILEVLTELRSLEESIRFAIWYRTAKQNLECFESDGQSSRERGETAGLAVRLNTLLKTVQQHVNTLLGTSSNDHLARFQTFRAAIEQARDRLQQELARPPGANETPSLVPIRCSLDQFPLTASGLLWIRKPQDDFVPYWHALALDTPQIGLALSGGGIRSATFNLGILQGLAEQQLLTTFDYFSTVSGGGYIGGWLGAWIKRDGNIRNVEKLMSSSRATHSKAVRDNVVEGPDGIIREDEPETIRHLRAYSNYLAPRPGVFTSDSWTLIATYARNLLLNQLVIIPTCLFVILTMLSFCWLHITSQSGWLVTDVLQRAANDKFAYWIVMLAGWISGTVIALVSGIVYLALFELRGKRDVPGTPQLARFGIEDWRFRPWPAPEEPKEPKEPRERWWDWVPRLAVFLAVVYVAYRGMSQMWTVGLELWNGILSAMLMGAAILACCIARRCSSEERWLAHMRMFWFFLILFCFFAPALNGPKIIPVLFYFYTIVSVFTYKIAVRAEARRLMPAWLNVRIQRSTSLPGRLLRSLAGVQQAEVSKAPTGNSHGCIGWIAVAMILAAFLFNLWICAVQWPDPIYEWMIEYSWNGLSQPTGLEKLLGDYLDGDTVVPFLIGGALLHIIVNLEAIRDLVCGRPRTTLACLRWLGSGAAAGAVGGGLLFGYINWLLPFLMRSPLLQVTCGPPILLLGFYVMESVQVGIVGSLEDEAIREWWSAFLAKVLMAAVAWFALFVLVLWCPQVLFWSSHTWTGLLTKATAIGGWVTAAFGALGFAHSEKSSGEGQRGVLDAIIMLGPPIFLSGLFVGLSAVLYCIVGPLLPTVVPFRAIELGQELDWWLLIAKIRSGSFFNIGIVLWPLAFVGLVASLCVDVNLFSLQHMYANRLIRCYLGASRQITEEGRKETRIRSWQGERSPDMLTGFDTADDLPLKGLRFKPPPGEMPKEEWPQRWLEYYTGPVHIINTAINLARTNNLAWQERMADSFVLTPWHYGSYSTGYRSARMEDKDSGSWTEEYDGNVTLGRAVSLSGAAVSPNMGYYSSPAVGALLTVFNLRLGAWLGNPAHPRVRPLGSPWNGWWMLAKESLGSTSERSKYVYLSDGGHFDNLGVYELIRRRCRFIVACDAGADPTSGCFELALLIRKVRIDFGIDIEIDTDRLRVDPETGFALGHVAVGRIRYSQLTSEKKSEQPDAADGYLIYIKPTLTGDETADILSYKRKHAAFPHDSTLNQFFSESQFESYRQLGFLIAKEVFEDADNHHMNSPMSRAKQVDLFERIYQRFEPNTTPDSLTKHLQLNQGYIDVHKTLATSSQLTKLSLELLHISVYLQGLSPEELLGTRTPQDTPHRQAALAHHNTPRSRLEFVAERETLIQMFTILEEVFFSFGLGRYDQTTSNGWIQVVRQWIMTSTFQANWVSIRKEFSPEFERYCSQFKVRLEPLFNNP